MSEANAALTFQEIRVVVEEYIGVNGGYLGDFSYRTHQEFYQLYCNLDDIDVNKHEGTTRERFIKILKGSDPLIQAKILHGVLERYPIHSSDLRTASRYDQIFSMILRLESLHKEAVTANDDVLAKLIELLRSDWLLTVVGYFVNHRPALPYSRLDDEYKVQDLVYCLVSSLIPDLHFENPQSKNIGALTHTRVDFSSRNKHLFVETKLATNRHDAKQIEREISEDIVKYGRQRGFSTLIFFIYCFDYAFPNAREFERGFTGKKIIDGHEFLTVCIIKP